MVDLESLPQLGFSMVEKANRSGIPLRTLGAVAFRIHCPNSLYIQSKLARKLSDIDFASRASALNDVKRFFSELGWQSIGSVITLYGGNRVALTSREDPSVHADIFLDKLEFNHDVEFGERLLIDKYTIPLAELLLEKMQIVKINRKDIVDTVMLLREHEVGHADSETVNTQVISKVMANDWGFYKTFMNNLDVVSGSLDQMRELEADDRKDVAAKISKIRNEVEAEPKLLRWRMRASVGERRKWYRDVEELSR